MMRWVITILLVGAGVFAGLWGWTAWSDHHLAEQRAAMERRGLEFARTPGAEDRITRLAREACRCARTGGGTRADCWGSFDRIVAENGGSQGGAPAHPVSPMHTCFGPLPPTEVTLCIQTEWAVWRAPPLCTREEYLAVEAAMLADPSQADETAARMARAFASADRTAP